jgi:hypothetical protein
MAPFPSSVIAVRLVERAPWTAPPVPTRTRQHFVAHVDGLPGMQGPMARDPLTCAKL